MNETADKKVTNKRSQVIMTFIFPSDIFTVFYHYSFSKKRVQCVERLKRLLNTMGRSDLNKTYDNNPCTKNYFHPKYVRRLTSSSSASDVHAGHFLTYNKAYYLLTCTNNVLPDEIN